MTMAVDGWGSGDEQSAAVLDRYLEAGGTVLDTADVLPVEAVRRLDEVGAPASAYPYEIFGDAVRAAVMGGGRAVRQR